MKSRFAPFLFAVLLLLSGCVSSGTHEKEVAEAQEAGYEEGYNDGYGDGYAAALGIEDPVYVTLTGTKYHRSWCSHLDSSKILMSRLSAFSQGYTPCSACNP